jgi:hypothetical protein
MRSVSCLALLALLSMCSTPPPPQASSSFVAAPVPPPVSSSPPADSPEAGPPAAEATGRSWSVDLDGDGTNETIRVSSGGSFELDPARGPGFRNLRCKAEKCTLTVEPGSGGRAFELLDAYPTLPSIEVIDIDRKDRVKELLVRTRAAMEEDPPYIFTVIHYDGTGVHVQELAHGHGYSTGTFRAPGNGRFVTEYADCPDLTTTVYELRGGALAQTSKKTVRVRRPNECAACPMVYVLEDGGFRKRGEILRNLRAPSLAGLQSLDLISPARFVVPAPGGLSRVVVELREEKDETTFLDDVALEIGGIRYAPRACSAPLDYCTVDGAHHLMRRGDALRLTFDVPAPVPEGRARLWATGHYVPDS